jgi:hypothetical protein
MEQAFLLYSSVNSVSVCPPGAEMKVLNFTQAGGQGGHSSTAPDRMGSAGSLAKHNFVSDFEKRASDRDADVKSAKLYVLLCSQVFLPFHVCRCLSLSRSITACLSVFSDAT